MLVSIITSVFNCEKYISAMLDSILSQTYHNWELIIFDDASTDNTWNLIQTYNDKRIIKLQNSKNKGLTYNLNRALKLAKGKYVIRIDGDDMAYSQRIEKQVEYMEKNTDVVLSGCWMKAIGEEKCICQSILDEQAININLLFDTVIFHPTFIMRKSILDKFNIKYNEELKYAQDYDLEVQLKKYGKIKNISEILVYYRIHDFQISAIRGKEQEECANQTRKAVLKELGIILDEKEFSYWNIFCLLKYCDLKQNEIDILKNICENIILKNKIKNIYDSILLKKILLNRLSNFINECKTISDKSKKNITNKYQELYLMMCQWMKLKQSGKSLISFFQENNIHSIAIYGIGVAGSLLIDELFESDIEIKYGIDKNKNIFYYENRINIINMEEDKFKEVDAIVVTAISDFEEIKKELHGKIKSTVFSLSDIIFKLI